MSSASARVEPAPAGREGRALAFGAPLALVALALLGWWWSARMAAEMTAVAPPMPGVDEHGMHMDGMGSHGHALSLGAFALAWLAMMAAMMLPAVMPVAKLYARAAHSGRAAPVPFFVSGYLVLWVALALPGYFAWRALAEPLASGHAWVARVAGATLLLAAVWQLSPLKSVCLRHCRSPLGFFLRFGGRISRPAGALRMGLAHGAFCVGCCWALFAVLVAFGTMNLLWMVAFTALIVAEKHARHGERIATLAGAAMSLLGLALIFQPSLLTHLT